MSAEPTSTSSTPTADRVVGAAIAVSIALLLFAAYRGTVPNARPAERRADAPLRIWTASCARCHGLDGLGITGRGGDVTRSAHDDADALRRLLGDPAHASAIPQASGRQVEDLLEQLRVLRTGGAP